jgi:hypothetical protein
VYSNPISLGKGNLSKCQEHQTRVAEDQVLLVWISQETVVCEKRSRERSCLIVTEKGNRKLPVGIVKRD